MDTTEGIDQNVEINKVRQLLAKNIDDFKYLVLCNMRLSQNVAPSDEPLHLDINRVSGYQQETTENLEKWVSKEFAPKLVKKEGHVYTIKSTKQMGKSKNSKSSGTIIDLIEQWLMNEAKKDLFVEMDAMYGGPEGLSSEAIRELGSNLISLADKLDEMKLKAGNI